MKLKGKTLSEVNTDMVIFPRPEGDIVFKIAAIVDDSDFIKICPLPEPPMSQKPGEPAFKNDKHPLYLEKMANRFVDYTYFLWIKGMEATEGLEWETVRLSDPETWKNIETELQSSGFSKQERKRLLNAILEVNSITDDSVERARKRFFEQVAAEARASISQKAALPNT